MYIHTSSYSIHYSMPFSVYGENLIIMCQNFVIVLLFWTYSKHISTFEKIFCLIFMSSYSYVLFSDQLLDNNMWELVAQSNIFFSNICFMLIRYSDPLQSPLDLD